MELNPQPQSRTAGPGFTPAIRPLVFAVIACIIVVILFSPAGVIYQHADLSFLVAPFICYFVLRFLARLSSIYLPGYGSASLAAAAACVFNGLAFAIFLLLFLMNAEMLTNIGGFNHISGFLTDLSATAGYAVLFVLARTVSRLADISRETPWGASLYPPGKGLGQFFMGLAIWKFLAVFSGSWSTLNEIGLIIFAGMIAVALGNAGHYGTNSKNPFISDASNWLVNSVTLEFFTGAFIAVYILLIRPFITDLFSYAAFVEWGIVCLLGWRLFSGIKSGIRTRCAVDVYDTDWQKHVQIIANLQGADFPQLREIQEAFIEDGGRDSLLIYLTLLLHNNKVPAEEIHRILHPLINYKDARIPWFAFGWEQRRVSKQNETNRRAVLGEIIANLKYIMNPANQKIEEQANEEN